ncbi:transcriptional regulator [Oceanicoccus sagamiensis]|uniref:Transcriptional regulator n=1 Tax=Oceanicoccus sagamiensis TaxID=716816 RepID=A0A1X9NJQ9_9GAMM|nr:transcriptional regulator [Oceanicoccus sagamiensis]ARN76075.1 transcriptional regulator [Oceanicoccus sagamiensis]
MDVIEIPHFTDVVASYLSDDEYAALQWYLLLNPDAGDLIQGTGGIRKVRWFTSWYGKRGGLRVIYYYRRKPMEIWMLTVYSKSKKQDLTTRDKEVLKQIVREIKYD